ncbi:Rid family detoxifying hydrolase [Curtobacterium sp. MCBA15_008]|uniref:Rid family detoxifying hydrolase n=1 Tax=Curtobacterium sp. MCBA15_008 TaxID=1898736 RepID=UPI0008DCA818|nr:Rid family detoxifying hydrolase [Curtobacterium sp. MCBA15_008]OII12475.1 reactive intermediate/imine deaminase [Curtobacterium sp. MCBA15_008]
MIDDDAHPTAGPTGRRRVAVVAAEAPDAVGPYAHAATASGLGALYLSGQTPIDPSTGELAGGDVAEQTRQVFTNLRSVLSAAQLTFDDVIKINVYLVSMDDFTAMNTVYAANFTPPYPARTTVAVAGLPLGARVEIELVAATPR